MFATALIVFRETLEAALFIGIVAAAAQGVAGLRRLLTAGVLAGVLGAVTLAVLAERISGWLDGLGQDVVTIGVLSFALLLLLWHCIWVSSHAGETVAAARRLGQGVRGGARGLWALAGVVALAVLREGAETVLFVGGSVAGNGGARTVGVLLAGIAGLAAGAAVGIALYAGLRRIPLRHIFSVTQVLVALLAGSMASQLVRTLAQAGFLESGASPLWDSSSWIAPDSLPGAVLHGLVGYDARPSVAQLIAYVAVLGLIYVGTRLLAPPVRAPAH
jgi:high-affinity iron transporter